LQAAASLEAGKIMFIPIVLVFIRPEYEARHPTLAFRARGVIRDLLIEAPNREPTPRQGIRNSFNGARG
jgi:hypothetical protein